MIKKIKKMEMFKLKTNLGKPPFCVNKMHIYKRRQSESVRFHCKLLYAM
jgi:hypothetical protein